jgi:hypothetical protein
LVYDTPKKKVEAFQICKDGEDEDERGSSRARLYNARVGHGREMRTEKAKECDQSVRGMNKRKEEGVRWS